MSFVMYCALRVVRRLPNSDAWVVIVEVADSRDAYRERSKLRRKYGRENIALVDRNGFPMACYSKRQGGTTAYIVERLYDMQVEPPCSPLSIVTKEGAS